MILRQSVVYSLNIFCQFKYFLRYRLPGYTTISTSCNVPNIKITVPILIHGFFSNKDKQFPIAYLRVILDISSTKIHKNKYLVENLRELNLVLYYLINHDCVATLIDYNCRSEHHQLYFFKWR